MDNFCPLPWVHLASDTDGLVRLCCRSDVVSYKDKKLNLDGQSVKQVWNSPAYKKIRKEFINNQQPLACKTCFDEEQVGKLSKRVIELKKWGAHSAENLIQQTGEEGEYKPLPVSYDLRLGNVCNLKCRMCYPKNSSALELEYRKLNATAPKLFTQYEKIKPWWKQGFIEEVKAGASSLRRIACAGGEPSLSKDLLELFEWLSDHDFSRHIDLEITTNLSLASDKWLDALNSFKSVQISCSLDGYKEVNSYIRYPSEWSEIVENLNRYGRLPQVSFIIAPALQVYNAFRFTDLFKAAIAIRKNSGIYFLPQVVSEPAYLHVSILPESFKQQCKKRILDFIEYEDLFPSERQSLLAVATQFDKNNDFSLELREKFKAYTEILDQSRRQKCLQVLPELKPFMENIHN